MQRYATLLQVTEAIKSQWSAEPDKNVHVLPLHKLCDELIVVEGLLVRSNVLVPPATFGHVLLLWLMKHIRESFARSTGYVTHSGGLR